jgi:hypothetical protein
VIDIDYPDYINTDKKSRWFTARSAALAQDAKYAEFTFSFDLPLRKTASQKQSALRACNLSAS